MKPLMNTPSTNQLFVLNHLEAIGWLNMIELEKNIVRFTRCLVSSQ